MRSSGARDGAVAAATIGLVFALAAGVARLWPVDRQIRLRDVENSVFSQAGEDGILEKIFEVIEPTSRFGIEFGASDGVENSNLRNLIVRHGWRALLIEGDAELTEALHRNYRGFPGVRTVREWVFPANVELLFEENGVPPDLDLLVIDIDSNDYYVWRAIREYRPKVVMIEYNGLFAPPLKMVIDFHPMMYWSGEDFHYGASIQSYYELGERKGYELIGANYRGLNLFFVEKRYFARFAIADNSPARLYRPLNFSVSLNTQVVRESGLPKSEDLVLPESAIKKRFRFDR